MGGMLLAGFVSDFYVIHTASLVFFTRHEATRAERIVLTVFDLNLFPANENGWLESNSCHRYSIRWLVHVRETHLD